MPMSRPIRAHVGGREAPQKKLIGPTTRWEYKERGDVLIRWRGVCWFCEYVSVSKRINRESLSCI